MKEETTSDATPVLAVFFQDGHRFAATWIVMSGI
jgi:hypothetical protein